ncbi:P-loop containing nucleoside triphosphate hydrolase protein, partial [Panaeolus papilionaceus]
VNVGVSGVGKTSFCVKYINGRFSTVYRPTIGVDFITKTIRSPDGGDLVLQTRLSFLVYFRPSHTVILMYDVNDRSLLYKLIKWWCDFCAHAPVRDEDRAKFCEDVVGNKVDVVEGGAEGQDERDQNSDRVSRDEAMSFRASWSHLTMKMRSRWWVGSGGRRE